MAGGDGFYIENGRVKVAAAHSCYYSDYVQKLESFHIKVRILLPPALETEWV